MIVEHETQLVHQGFRQPEISPGLLRAREWGLSLRLFYAQMRQLREQGNSNIIDVGSSIETDESEHGQLEAIVRQANEESIEAGDYTAYASSYGTMEMRSALAGFYNRWGCPNVDMHDNIMVTGGTIDAVSRVIRSLDTRAVIIPSWAPFFPREHALIAGRTVIEAPLNVSDGSFDLAELDQNLTDAEIQPSEALMYVAQPASPIGTVMEDDFIERELIPYLRKRGVLLLSDSTVYSTRFDGTPMRSMLSYEGFSDIGVEATTISKELGLPGVRIGGLVGNKDLINAVRILASAEVDILPAAQQRIADRALSQIDPFPVGKRIAQELHTETLPRLAQMQWQGIVPKAGVDMMIQVPPGYKNAGFHDPSLLASFSFLRRYGVGLSPGSVFSTDGKNYLRLGLKQKKGKVSQALDSMVAQGFDWQTDEPTHDDMEYLHETMRTLDVTKL